MPEPGPVTVRWTHHAAAKAHALGVPLTDLEDAVLRRHAMRTANPGAARWRIRVGRLVVAYDYPDGGDGFAARVVTLWRTRAR